MTERGAVASAARGATILTGSMLVANLGNYFVNVMLGRWLTPSEFSDATLMVTLMLVATALAISLQLIAAKVSTEHDETANAWLTSRALLVGMFFGGALALGAPVLSRFFNTSSSWPFAILGLGMPFYAMQSVGRGVLQGSMRFVRLALTFAVEVAVRAAISVVLVAAGFGVIGATIGLSASFAATWLFVARDTGFQWSGLDHHVRSRVVAVARPVAVLLLAQVIINNEDVLFSKRYLDPTSAGRYGAVALIGRGIFFASWAVATAVFPVAAARTEPVGRTDRLLMGAFAAVMAIGSVAVIGALFLGDTALGKVFGPEYIGLSRPLAAYAVVTTLFAVSNLFATYHLSLGNVVPSVLLLLGAVTQTGLLFVARHSIDSIVQAQFFAMATLTAAILCHHFALPSLTARSRRRMATA